MIRDECVFDSVGKPILDVQVKWPNVIFRTLHSKS